MRSTAAHMLAQNRTAAPTPVLGAAVHLVGQGLPFPSTLTAAIPFVGTEVAEHRRDILQGDWATAVALEGNPGQFVMVVGVVCHTLYSKYSNEFPCPAMTFHTPCHSSRCVELWSIPNVSSTSTTNAKYMKALVLQPCYLGILQRHYGRVIETQTKTTNWVPFQVVSRPGGRSRSTNQWIPYSHIGHCDTRLWEYTRISGPLKHLASNHFRQVELFRRNKSGQRQGVRATCYEWCSCGAVEKPRDHPASPASPPRRIA